MKRILGLFFAFILIITTAIPLFSYAEGNYGVDLSSASYGASINPFTAATLDPGWCTCYAWGRAHEKLGASIPWVPGASDAKAWATNARNANWPVDTTPKSDSIAVWESGGGGYGHVAYVEVVENGKMYISESNYNNTMGYSEGVFDLATGYYIGTYNDSNAYSRGLPDWYIHIASTVSFDANGGIDAPADLIKVAGKITSIPSTIPRRAGYSFVHWNSSSDGGGGITLNPGDQWGGDFDIILYAIWKVDKGSEMSSGYDRVLPDGDYQITCTSNTSFYLDIDGTVSPAANGTNVAIWGSEGDNPNEYDIWTITYSNGFYSIRQKGTDMCLDVHEDNGSKIRFGTNVQVWSNESASNQLWAISKNGNGYRLQAKCSGFSLEYADGNLSNGTNVIQNPNNDSEAQRWSFFKYDPTHFSGGGGGGGGGGWGDDGVDTVTSSGGSFVFGQWEQDGDTSNGAEPLHWRILYEEGGFKYAICDSIIEIRAFGGGLQNWERSNLRSWLNGEFYQTAFNDSEKAKIVKRDQLNLGNDFWIASDDRGTADFVFLPSQKEVLQLLPNKNDRRASPSAYARDNAKLGNDIEFVSWWLRTNGIFIGQAMTVEPNGDINTDGQYGGDKAGVRPVIWVSGAKNGSDPGGGGGGTVWDVADVPTNAASPMPTLTPVPTNYQPPIADSYATPTPPSSSAGNIAAFPQTAYTNMEKVNVRNAANGEKITRIEERGTAITVLGETADTNGTHWYSVRLSNGVEGYIRADLVSFTFDPSWKTTPAPVVSSSPFSSYLAKTTTKKVNVRTRADGESKTVTQIKDAGTVVTVIGEEYSANRVLWYAVVLADGRNGYIRGDLLERVNGDASATIRSLMDKDHGDFRIYDVAFFRSRDYDAHSGPGTQYLRGANGNAYMSTNDSVYFYGRENNWILVQYSISTDHWRFAYIRDDAVASSSIPALSFEYRQATAAQQSIITDDPLHSQSALTTVNAGESILYLACLDQWAYVEYKNVRGFIPSSAINQQIVSTSTPVSPTVGPSVSDILMVNQPQIANYATDNTTGIDYINNEILLIKNKDADAKQVEDLISKMDGVIVGYNTILHEYQIQFKTISSLSDLTDICFELSQSELVRNCYPNYVYSDDLNSYYPNDSRWSTGDETSWNNNANLHWGADAIRLPETWEFIRSCSLSTVNVGVFDHMFYDEHEDLSFAETFLNSFTDNSHGTHVAGIIAATQDNGKGISGVSPNAKLYGYSVNGRRNQSDDQKTNVYGLTVMEEQAALTWFICLNDCKIINYSWGKPPKYTYRSEKMTIEQYESGEFYNLVCEEYDNEINPLIDCLNQFLEEGYDFLIVASAGNNNNVEGSVQDAKLNSIMTYISTPELHNRIIVVGSAGTSDNVHYRVSDYSNYGMRVDLLAPGENIYSTVYTWDVILNTLNGGSGHSSYDYMSGTSMAAPQVSGTAAVIWGINPELTGPEVKRIITETATGMYSYRFDQSFTRPYIYPMLDACAAVKAAYATITTNENWASIYRDYVIGGGITYTFHPAENSWEDPYYTDIFGLEYYQYNDDYLPICFSLYDMDRNGVPELFGYNGGGEGAFGTVYAFTVEDGEMKYLGDVATREGAVFYYDNDLYPGVFDESMHMDYHGIGYSYLEDGGLKGTLVASYESWFDAADEMHERLTERTSDESLWSVYKNDTPKAIESYTIKEIESMSWEVFVMQVQP